MRTLILIAAIAISGCATIKMSELSTIESKIGTVPNIGEQAAAPVGGVLYSQFKYFRKVGYRLQNDLSIGLGLGRVSVSAGDFVLKAEVENKTAFCSEKLAYIDPMVGPHETACFTDADNDGKFESLKAAPGVIWFNSEITPPIAYEKSELILPNKDAFKYELLYQGITKGTLKLSYREYINDFARPAFFQDVTYDLDSMPATITFRTVRLEVISANNNQISYRVLSGF